MSVIRERWDYHTCRLPAKTCLRSNMTICTGLFRPETLPKMLLSRYPAVNLPRLFKVERILGGGKSGAVVLQGFFRSPKASSHPIILKLYLDAFNVFDQVSNERPFRELYTQCALSGEAGFNCAACFGIGMWPSEWVSTPKPHARAIIDQRFIRPPPPSKILYMAFEPAPGSSLMRLHLAALSPEEMAGMVVELAAVWQRAQRKLGPTFGHYDLHPGNVFVDTKEHIRKPLYLGGTKWVFPRITIIDFDLTRSALYSHKLPDHKLAEQSLLGLRERTIQFVLRSLPASLALQWFAFLAAIRRLLPPNTLSPDQCQLLTYGFVAYLYQIPSTERADPSRFFSQMDKAFHFLLGILRAGFTSITHVLLQLLELASSDVKPARGENTTEKKVAAAAAKKEPWGNFATSSLSAFLDAIRWRFPDVTLKIDTPRPVERKAARKGDTQLDSDVEEAWDGTMERVGQGVKGGRRAVSRLKQEWSEWTRLFSDRLDLSPLLGGKKAHELRVSLMEQVQVAVQHYYRRTRHFVSLDDVAIQVATLDDSSAPRGKKSLFRPVKQREPQAVVFQLEVLGQRLKMVVVLHYISTVITFREGLPKLEMELDCRFYLSKEQLQKNVGVWFREWFFGGSSAKIRSASVVKILKAEVAEIDEKWEEKREESYVQIQLVGVTLETIRGLAALSVVVEWSQLLRVFALGGWVVEKLLPFLRGIVEAITRRPNLQLSLTTTEKLQFLEVQLLLTDEPHPCVEAIYALLDRQIRLSAVVECISEIQAASRSEKVFNVTWQQWLQLLGEMQLRLLFTDTGKQSSSPPRVVSVVPLCDFALREDSNDSSAGRPYIHLRLIPHPPILL